MTRTRRKSLATRRQVLAGGAAAGLSLAAGIAAPPILAATRAPVKLGVLNTFSGASAFTGIWNWDGIQVYLDQINHTMAGRKVELIKEDDEFSPQVALQKLRKFTESDKVDMVVGIQGSNIALAVLNYIKEHKTFLLISGAGTDAITWQRIPYMFRSSISSWQLCHPFAGWIHNHLGKEMVVISEDYAGGHDVAAEIIAPYKANGGTIMKEIYVPLDTTDYSPYLTVIRSLNPPVVYDFSTGGTHCIRFVQQWAQSGIKAHLTGFAGLVDSTTIAAQGKAALGVMTSTIYLVALDNPVNKRFVADYHAKTKEMPNLFSDYGYVSMQVINETLKLTDGDTSNKDKLAEAMAKVRFNAPRGPFRFDPVTHNPIQNVYISKAEERGGKIVNVAAATLKDVRAPGKKEA